MLRRNIRIGLWLARSVVVCCAALVPAGCTEIEQAVAPAFEAPDPSAGQPRSQGGAPSRPQPPVPTRTPGPAHAGALAAMVGAREPVLVVPFDGAEETVAGTLADTVRDLLVTHPDAAFDLVAVIPPVRDVASATASAARARERMEGVLRTLTVLGASAGLIRVLAATSRDGGEGEVRLYVRERPAL